MKLDEATIESVALEWFGEQSRVAPTLTRPLPAGEEKDCVLVLVERLREAIRRLNFSIPEAASACASPLADRRATIKRYLKVRFVRRLKP